MMIRFRSLLIRFLYAAALLGPPLPGPYLRTYLRAAMQRCNAAVDVSDPICFFVSATQIRTGLGFLKGGTE
jgi:hypothetical protein